MLLATTTVACNGFIGDLVGSKGKARAVLNPVDGCEVTAQPKGAVLRGLTREEYNHTVRDLLGVTTRPADRFPADAKLNGFENMSATQSVTLAQSDLYERVAEDLAGTVDLARLKPCAEQTESCARKFIEVIGRRAFRRALEASTNEVEGLLAVFRVGQVDGFDAGLRMVLRAILQSGSFLYRAEGARQEAEQVKGYEMASRLSYFLWGTMPDDALLDAAGAGKLDTPDGVSKTARAMLADPKAKEMVRSFHRQWLDFEALDRAEKTSVANFSNEIRPALWAEADAFVTAVWEEKDLSKIFTAPYTFVSKATAPLYGVAAPATGLQRIELKAGERAGFLSLAPFLAGHSKESSTSPILRGHFIRTMLMCQTMPPPPDNFAPPPDDPTLTTRERYEVHLKNPTCSNCHVLMNPLGFGLERFDELGRYRETENGRTINDSGEVVNSVDAGGAFKGAVELSQKLAQSSEVKRCMATQWFRFAMGRQEVKSDLCALKKLESFFTEAGMNGEELLVRMTQADSFLFRFDGSQP